MADLSSQAAIRRLADEASSRLDRLDVLVNNAGGIFLKRQESADGIEMTFALNHLSYFLLTEPAAAFARAECARADRQRGVRRPQGRFDRVRRHRGETAISAAGGPISSQSWRTSSSRTSWRGGLRAAG